MAIERERPAAIEAEERRTLERLRSLARLLDEAVRIPGTNVRVGIDPVLGVLPVAGDAVAAIASLYIVREALELGVSRRTAAGMLLRVAAEFVVGSVPLLGPLIDAGWKVNVANVERIEAHVERTTD